MDCALAIGGPAERVGASANAIRELMNTRHLD